MSKKLVVGLFGTCGNSTWREPFIEEFDKRGISYFNPQIEDWEKACAEAEAKGLPSPADQEVDHMANDAVLLWPVLGETFGTGSLAEVGFSIIEAIRLDKHRDLIVLIEPDVSDELKENSAPIAVKESQRARALVKAKLKALRFDNVYIVETLEEMLEVSIELYEAAKIRVPLQEKLNPHRR